MKEEFELPVNHKGKEVFFPARLLNFGYIYKIEVDIFGVLVHLEKDDERNWRAILVDPALNFEKTINKELINDIITSIEELMGTN